jgi:beta-lactamase class A
MVGIEKVNRLCESIGCINTRIERYLMDVKAKEKGKDNTTSAKDMLTLLEYMLKKSPYKKEMVTILENQQFSHKLAAYLTNEKLKIAHKTGELPGIEHDVGLFQYKNQVVYASVMLHELKDNVTGQQLIAQVGKVIMEFMVGRG